MRFDPAHIPTATTAKVVRSFLRAYRHVGWPAEDYPRPDPRRVSRDDVRQWFGCDLTDALLGKGLLEQAEAVDAYRVTALGNRLAPQSLLPRLRRAKADRIVAEFLDRVAEVNASDEQIHYVAEVVAFGSYIGDAGDLGDIDLVVYRSRRPMSLEEYRRRSEVLRIQAAKTNKLFHDPYHWDEQAAFRRLLLDRSPYLSFHPESDLRKAGERRTIYRLPPMPADETRWAV